MTEDTPEGFSAALPLQPKVWDASRIKVAQQCMRKHWYSTVQGLRRKPFFNGPLDNIHTEFGKIYHHAVESFDRMILEGVSKEDATLVGLGRLLSHTWLENKPWGGTIEECWQCSDPAMRPQKRDASKLTKNTDRCAWAKRPDPLMPIEWHKIVGGFRCASCGLPAVKSLHYLPFHPVKNRQTLVDAFLTYAHDEAPIELIKINGEPAIEKLYRIKLPDISPDGDQYELAVLLDSVVNWLNQRTIRERKTTSMPHDTRYWNQFDPSAQIDTYNLVGGVLWGEQEKDWWECSFKGNCAKGFDGCPYCIHHPAESGDIVVLVESMKISASGCALERMPFYLPRERREEWLREIREIIAECEHRAYMVQQGSDPEACFPRRTASCHEAYGSCTFLPLCRARSQDRAEMIKREFQVDRWNPLAQENGE